MQPQVGRKIVVEYATMLVQAGLSSKTIRNYMGTLKMFFQYIIVNPYIMRDGKHIKVQDVYGPIEQPVSEYV
jgi:site-specific recombinase XerD